jgi:hypothetical protein
MKALSIKMKLACDAARRKEHEKKSSMMRITASNTNTNTKSNWTRKVWFIPKKNKKDK